MAWAAAKPADSKPIPLNNVFASTTAYKAGVTTLAISATRLTSLFEGSPLKLSW